MSLQFWDLCHVKVHSFIIIIIIIHLCLLRDASYCDACKQSVVSTAVIIVHFVAAVWQNKMPFGTDSHVTPVNIVLDRGPSPTGRGDLAHQNRTPHQSKSELQIAARPLQIAEWLVQTAYRNSATPCPLVPSLSVCCLGC